MIKFELWSGENNQFVNLLQEIFDDPATSLHWLTTKSIPLNTSPAALLLAGKEELVIAALEAIQQRRIDE